jgi:hypothetical protein
MGRALNSFVTGIETRHRAYAQLQPDELWCPASTYGENDFLMAAIKRSVAISHLPVGEDRIAYGGNHIALWRKLPRAMAKIIPVWRKLSGGRSPLEGADAL